MSKIICEHCKTSIEVCPVCGEEFDHHLLIPIVVLLISLILTISTGLKWQGSLAEHSEAMRLRKAYLKSNPDVRQLPIKLR